MKVFTKKLLVALFVLIIVISISCNTTKYNLHLTPVFNKDFEQPIGVDSLIVARSDSIMQYLFVDFSSEQKAKKLAKKAHSYLDQADSIWKELKQIVGDSAQLFSIDYSDSNTNVLAQSSDLIKKTRDNLQNSEKNFLQSIKLNPFPWSTKEGLAQTYVLWAKIENPEIYYEKGSNTFSDIVNYEKGEHFLFYNLGECYFNLKKWGQALKNYRQAEKVLLATTSFFSNNSHYQNSLKDSSKKDLYFTYLYSQAVCLARMYKAKEALATIKRAKKIVSSDKNRKIVERFEDWLNWDNGNIQAAEQKSQIIQLIKEGKYSESVSKFVALKNQLSDQFALDEIEWRIASLEFKYLGKKEQACNRLLNVVKKNEKISYYPPHLLPTYNKYVTDCGVMHFHLGMDYIQKADYKKAQQYLEQGAKINWYGNYKCQLELAKLNKHDPQTSLEIIESVLQTQSDLTDAERLSALEIKLGALKKLGPQYLNETKQIYHQIRELQKK